MIRPALGAATGCSAGVLGLAVGAAGELRQQLELVQRVRFAALGAATVDAVIDAA